MNTTPFFLRIFGAAGGPDGLHIVEKSNWIGKALVFLRALQPDAAHLHPMGWGLSSHLKTEIRHFSLPIKHLPSHLSAQMAVVGLSHTNPESPENPI